MSRPFLCRAREGPGSAMRMIERIHDGLWCAARTAMG